MLAQNRNDLLFRKPLPLHSSVPSEGPDSNAPWRKSSVAGQDEECRRSDPVLAETNEIDILEKLTAQFIARRYVWSAT